MKIANVGLDNAYAIVRGWVSALMAASTGLATVTDETTGTTVGPVTQMTLVGQLLNDGGDGTLFVDVQAVLTEYTNDSGVDLVYGDVVVIDSTADIAVTTTTTAQDTRPVGIVLANIGAGGTGPVQTGGVVQFINVTASVTRGNFAETSTTAKKATENATRRQGSFGVYLETGTTPTLLLFGIPDSSGTGPTGAGNVYTVETQNYQDGRYLQQDGTFRDPLMVGAGTLSVGSLTTITDDTKYNSWPAICRMRNGQMLMIYHKGNSHDTDNTGKVVGKIGDEAIDGTVTWGSEFDVYDHATLNVTPAGVSAASTGRTFAGVMRWNVSVANTGEAGIVYSDDYGVTWSDWITLTNTFTQEAYTAGPAVELPDGSLIISIEGTNTGTAAANRSSATVLSTDQGVTWGSQVSVRTYAADSRPYYESRLILLNNAGTDELIILHRTSNSTGNIYIQRSTNLGATTGGWGTPAIAFAGYGRPGSIQRWTGTILATTRKNSDASVVAFTSTDYGATWDAGTSIATGMYESEYADVVDQFNQNALIVFGTQPTSSLTNADIKTVPVAETMNSLRSVGTVTGFATPAIVLGTAAAAGAATTVIRSDATIKAFNNVTPTAIAYGTTVGTSAYAAEADHGHNTPLTTKGDLLVTTGAALNRLAVGTDAQVLTASSAATNGVAWADAPATSVGPDHAHVADERHLSDGSTTTYRLDEFFLDGSVEAMNITTLAWLGVTEVSPDQATVSAAGTAGDTIQFTYAAVAV